MGASKTSLHASCLEGVPLKLYSLLNKNYHFLAKSEHLPGLLGQSDLFNYFIVITYICRTKDHKKIIILFAV